MDKIIIDVSKGELEFIREALITKQMDLINHLFTCEEKSAESEPVWGDIRGFSESEIDEDIAMFSSPKKKPSTYKRKAPYGLKKDGTPKKKSGRPTKELF